MASSRNEREVHFDGAPCAVKAARTVLSGGKAGNFGYCRLTYRNLAQRVRG